MKKQKTSKLELIHKFADPNFTIRDIQIDRKIKNVPANSVQSDWMFKEYSGVVTYTITAIDKTLIS